MNAFYSMNRSLLNYFDKCFHSFPSIFYVFIPISLLEGIYIKLYLNCKKFSILNSIHSHPTHKMLTALTLELFDNTTLSNTNTLSNTKQFSDQSMYFINLNNVLSPKKFITRKRMIEINMENKILIKLKKIMK